MDRGAILLARDALATPDLRRLQLAAAAAGIGGWAFMVALAVHAYAVGGAAAVGLAALVRMAPAGLAAPLTGLAADRFPRRDVLLASTLARAVLLGAGRARRRARRAVRAAAGPRDALHRRRDRPQARPGRAAAAPRAEPHPPGRRQRRSGPAIDNGAFVVGAIAGGVLVAALRRAPRRSRPAALAFAAAARDARPHRRDPARAVASVSRSTRDEPARGRSRACASWRATGGCGCSSACCPRARSSRAWSTCSSSSPRSSSSTSATPASAGSTPAWGIGGLLGGAVALKLLARGRLRPRAARRRPADRRCRCSRSPALPQRDRRARRADRPRGRLRARRVAGHHAAAAARPRRRPRPRVRASSRAPTG